MFWSKKSTVRTTYYSPHCKVCGCLLHLASTAVKTVSTKTRMGFSICTTVDIYCGICAPKYDAVDFTGVFAKYIRHNVECDWQGKPI